MPLRFELPAALKLVHEMVMPVRWGDMDAMGHVNNTLYFRYFEIIRLDWFGRIGAPANPAGEGPVIVNACCSFLKQVEFPADILLRHFVADVGRTSFDTYFTLERCDQPGVVFANGGAKVVWVDSRLHQAVPLPEWLRQHIEPTTA
jgi:acyl-CoA thioester hydrolase